MNEPLKNEYNFKMICWFYMYNLNYTKKIKNYLTTNYVSYVDFFYFIYFFIVLVDNYSTSISGIISEYNKLLYFHESQ